MKTTLTLLLLLSAALWSRAQPAPKLLPFQGRLTDQNGVAVADGARLIQFRIYDVPAGGSAVWPGEIHRTTVNGGLVNVILGTKTALDTLDFNRTLYLDIVVDANGDNQITAADPPLLPRQAILPVLFAAESANSRKLAGFDWSVVFGPDGPSTGFINGQRLAPGSVTTTQLDPSVRGQLDPLKITLPALESIREHDAVADARDTNNQVRLIQASASTTARAAFFGFATGDATAGQMVTAQQYGLMSGFSGLRSGQSYYLGTNLGAITYLYPYGVQQYVGHAMSETTLFIDPFGMSKSWAWAVSRNYWGNRFDGQLITSSNISFPASVDGSVVVRQFSSFTINAGDTVTTSVRCRGLVIYVDGDATINGTLTMTARGAAVDPTLTNSIPASGIRLVRRKSGGPDALPHSDLGGDGAGGVGPAWTAVEAASAEILRDGMIYFIARSGGGGGGRQGGTLSAGFSGSSVLNGTGGGGGGGNDDPGSSGAGAAGTCYSGGSGGGGNHDDPGGAANGGANGGAGGAPSGLSTGGGAGNPPGANAEPGTGGLLVLFVRGKLTIGSGGRISSNGSQVRETMQRLAAGLVEDVSLCSTEATC